MNMEVLQAINEYLHTFSIPVVLIRLLLATICGGVIGFFRSMKKRGAGFKTHILVCLGATLIMMTGEYVFRFVSNGTGDVARMAAQVTTAAGLWACSGIGLAIGIGFYSGAIICTAIVFFVYNYMQKIDEFAYEHSRVYDLYVEFESRKYITPFMSAMKERGFKFLSLELSKSKKNKDDIVNATMSLEVSTKSKGVDVHTFIEGLEGVNSVEEM